MRTREAIERDADELGNAERGPKYSGDELSVVAFQIVIELLLDIRDELRDVASDFKYPRKYTCRGREEKLPCRL